MFSISLMYNFVAELFFIEYDSIWGVFDILQKVWDKINTLYLPFKNKIIFCISIVVQRFTVNREFLYNSSFNFSLKLYLPTFAVLISTNIRIMADHRYLCK